MFCLMLMAKPLFDVNRVKVLEPPSQVFFTLNTNRYHNNPAKKKKKKTKQVFDYTMNTERNSYHVAIFHQKTCPQSNP